jgi:uncharacterized protein YraI
MRARATILILLSWFCLAIPAHAEKRLALVIGNDTYQHIDKLLKAKADAKGYADLLREKGFLVEDRYDLGYDEMEAAVAGFVDRIEPGDTAVFVYSGHGWSDGAHNYLVGVDAPASASQERLTRLSVPIRNGATGVLDDFERKGAALKVAIIDACRDNPFQPPPGHKGYGLGRGLRPEGIEGSFVVYSAGEGQSALDRLSEADADPNSVFTRAFLPLLRADLPLLDAIKASQAKTHTLAASADHDQTPAYYDEVLGEACLSAACKTAVSPTRPAASVPPEEAFTAMIDTTTSADVLASLIAKLSDGPLKERAKARLAAVSNQTQIAKLTTNMQKPGSTSSPTGGETPSAPPERHDKPRAMWRVRSDISQGIANVRAGPGSNYALKGPPFPMPAGAGGIQVGECRPPDNGGKFDWCLINWKGASGWTSSRGIEVDSSVTWRVRSDVSQGILNVRVGPGVNYALRGPPFPMPAGAGGIQVGECKLPDNGGKFDWCLITWNGVSGWASSKGLEVELTQK